MRCLIIDGQNNHDWAVTTPILREQLESVGSTVTVITTPGKQAPGQEWDAFAPDFTTADVVISNFTDIIDGTPWPTHVLDALCNWVEQGGGFVSYHAAASAFLDHDRFWQMIGMGWREQGGHGLNEPFSVSITEVGEQHPVTAALAPAFEHASDELWFGMTGPATEGQVTPEILATALSPETQQEEPMLWTLPFGQGRCFVTVLGHDPISIQCPGFQDTFIKGCQWASGEF